MKRLFVSLTILVATAASILAQTSLGDRPWNFTVAAGFNIGASTPIGIPAEIRHIDSYSPALNLSVGGFATRMFNPRWGASIGLILENKGANTGIEARNYHLTMNIEQGDATGTKTGYYTGKIKNEIRIGYLSIPVHACFRPSSKVSLFAGPYLAMALSRSFIGNVSEGTMREDPLHPAIGVDKADYNYSSDIRRFDTGLSIATMIPVWQQLSVRATLQWGLLSTLDPSKRKIDMDTYNIYLNLGVAYTFP